jgi:hypothetical protein
MEVWASLPYCVRDNSQLGTVAFTPRSVTALVSTDEKYHVNVAFFTGGGSKREKESY